MLTPAQQKWIDHLSDTTKVVIFPFDSSCNEKFEKFKKRVQMILKRDLPFQHHGASSLGISGQDEIDVYLPVVPQKFNEHVNMLKEIFGEPGSLYDLARARFNAEQDGKKIDLFVVNREDAGWVNSLKFEKYLKEHQEVLEEYRKLKENSSGLSVREYYRVKTEFVNEVFNKMHLYAL